MEVIDESKKFFFLQRKEAAKEGRQLVQDWNDQKAKNRLEFISALKSRAAKAASSRDKARTARGALQAKRAEAAAALREQRLGFAEARQQQLTDHSLQVKEAVNGASSERFVQPEASRRMLQHPHYSEVAAVVADVTSSVSREIAASPRRRRPGAQAALTMQSPGSPQAPTRRI